MGRVQGNVAPVPGTASGAGFARMPVRKGAGVVLADIVGAPAEGSGPALFQPATSFSTDR